MLTEQRGCVIGLAIPAAAAHASLEVSLQLQRLQQTIITVLFPTLFPHTKIVLELYKPKHVLTAVSLKFSCTVYDALLRRTAAAFWQVEFRPASCCCVDSTIISAVAAVEGALLCLWLVQLTCFFCLTNYSTGCLLKASRRSC